MQNPFLALRGVGMKLLEIKVDGLPLFKERLDVCFYAQQRVPEDQKEILYLLFSNTYLNSAKGFIGINASYFYWRSWL